MYWTIASRSASLSAALAPIGGIGTPVVLSGSSIPRPRLMNSTSSASLFDAMNSLVVMSLPRPGKPLEEGYLYWRIATGGPGLPDGATPWNSAMPVWQDFFSEEEIWQVIAYIYAASGSTPRTWEH